MIVTQVWTGSIIVGSLAGLVTFILGGVIRPSENEEPMPIVIKRPVSSINTAATGLLSPIPCETAVTNVSIPPVAFMTSAKPDAAIMIRPIMAII